MSRVYRLFSLTRTLAAVVALVLTLTLVGNVSAAPVATGAASVEVEQAVQHDVSPPLRDMAQSFHASGVRRDQPLRLFPVPQGANAQSDPVVQSSALLPNVTTTAGVNINGVGDTSNTPANPCNCAPPDTNGAVGATQFTQWVNTAFAVYDKSGNLLMGPTAGNALWAGFGGPCMGTSLYSTTKRQAAGC